MDHVFCVGNRAFTRQKRYNFSTGKSQTTAFWLSVFLGLVGADRFYLGYTFLGFVKLASLGGVGFWSIVDMIMIALGYLRPSDGSLYI
jgi:TM2 domain-containing membrane protein YozV